METFFYALGDLAFWIVGGMFVTVFILIWVWIVKEIKGSNEAEKPQPEPKGRSLYDLAHDLCDGLDRDYQKTLVALRMAIKYERYTVEELWAINDEDSTRVYDIIRNYEHRNRKK